MQNDTETLLKKQWLENLTAFTKEFDFPKEAAASLLQDMDAVLQSPDTWKIFLHYDNAYDASVFLDYPGLLKELENSSSICHVHVYSLHLLFFIGLSRKTRKIYEQRGISMDIFHDSMSDLRWKLLECHKLHGIWGTCVAFWFDLWFEIRRFALGRFQYELTEFPDTYEKDGISLKPKDLVINVHIPSCGPLNREEYMKSYAMAARFFSQDFAGRPIVFFCESWMLFSHHKTFLPETSRILEFMQDYDVYKDEYTNGDLWRIFNCEEIKDPALLPENTSLQKAYRSWLMSGNSAGVGFGVFVYKNTHNGNTDIEQEI